MAKLTGSPTIGILDTDLYANGGTNAPAAEGVGQINYGANGKIFRMALAGVSNLVMGNLLQNSVDDTTYTNMAVGTAAVAGDSSIQVTNGTATITSDQFVGGSISVYTAGTVAVGDEYTITAITGTLTTGGALNVFVDRPLRSAMSTSAKVTMIRNPWSGVIQAPASTQTGIPVGVAIFAQTASNWGWVQTGGLAAALSDGSTFAIGTDLGTPSGTAGCVSVYVAGTTHARVGIAMKVAAAAKCIPVLLQID